MMENYRQLETNHMALMNGTTEIEEARARQVEQQKRLKDLEQQVLDLSQSNKVLVDGNTALTADLELMQIEM